MLDIKNPVKVRAGTLGAQKRWRGHVPAIVRLADLLPEEAEVVRALLRLKAAREDQESDPPDTKEASPADSGAQEDGVRSR
jgi:hypothetical protein